MTEATLLVHSVARRPGLIGRAMVMAAADRTHGAGYKGIPPNPRRRQASLRWKGTPTIPMVASGGFLCGLDLRPEIATSFSQRTRARYV